MKLMRVGQPGKERPAVAVDENNYIDISDLVSDFDADFFQNEKWFDIKAEVANRIQRKTFVRLPATESVRLSCDRTRFSASV